MLHNNETWAVAAEDIGRLERNEATMLHWACNVSIHVQQSVCVYLERKVGHQMRSAREMAVLVCSCDMDEYEQLFDEVPNYNRGGKLWKTETEEDMGHSSKV